MLLIGKKPLLHTLLAGLTAAAFAGPAAATVEGSDKTSSKVFGWVETGTIEPWGTEVKVKLDSGALTSSIHAINIEEFKRDGQKWVRYEVEVKDDASKETVSKTYEEPVYRRVLIRGAGGTERRYVVIKKVCMRDTIYEEQFTLSDRGEKIYPVLLGRRTIQSLGLIDVTRTFLHEPSCDENSEIHRREDKENDNLGS